MNPFEEALKLYDDSLKIEKTTEEVTEEKLTQDPVVQTTLPEAGTYTQDDLVENDAAYNVVENYMADRYGLQSIEGKTRTSIVDTFLNNRRGVSGGNTYRGLREMDYLNDIRNSDIKMARTAKAYELYENMAGLFSKKTSVAEKAEGIMDYTRTAILDPINLAGGLIGKIVGGGSVRVASKGSQMIALEAMKKKAASGATKEAVEKEGKKVFKNAVKAAGKKTQENVKEYTAQLLGTKGFKRLAQSGAMKEIVTVTSIEAAASVGMEALYQNSLIETGVRDDYDRLALGAAALGSVIIGGVQAAKIITRGELGPKASPVVATGPVKPKEVLKQLTEELIKYSENKMPITEKWTSRVNKGRELADQDSQFFVDLLLGSNDKDGNILFKGISSIAAENNIFWVRESDENVGNWVAEIIKQSRPEDLNNFVKAFSKATGNKLRQISAKKMTPEELANTFSKKISQAGLNLNALKQVADKNSVSLDDLEIETFLSDQLDLPFGVVKRSEDELDPTKFEKFLSLAPDVIQNNQNRAIRLLVSNPSTSALNTIGWGANTTLGSISDVAMAALYAGKGTLQKIGFMHKEGEDGFRIAGELLKSTGYKAKLMFDPDMTMAAFESAMARNQKAMQELESTLPGGVENTTKLLTNDKFTVGQKIVGQRLDDAVDVIQTLSFVKAQDRLTKSIEFVSQMDKALRLKFGKGWDEFYSDPNAYKVMATKEYAAMEALAVDKVQEAIFSKSYKGSGLVGQVAGFIEDVRNIPGLGLLVPFGRFFNATVDFATQASGLSVIGKMGGLYADKTYKELGVKAGVAYGLVRAMTDQENENRNQGLGLYQTVVDGEVITQQYDYPISLFKAAARLNSFYRRGETPPIELLEQMARDFTLEGVLRNLDSTQKDVGTFIYHAFSLELEESKRAAKKAFGGIGGQVISAGTRFLEPVNIAAGIIKGKDGRPIDRFQGDKFTNDAFRYIDNILPAFSGEKPVLQQAAKGEADATSTKVMGIRPIRLTQTERVMNMLSLDTFGINAARKIRSQAPEAANEYNRILFDVIESKSKALMNNKGFRNAKTKDQRIIWDKILKNSQEAARQFIKLQFSDIGDTVAQQYNITRKHSRKNIDNAREELGLSEDIDKLNKSQIIMIQEYLKAKDTLDTIRTNRIMTGN